MKRLCVRLSVVAALLFANAAVAGVSGPGGGSPTGPAGGDLAGTYPSPNVKSVTGRTFALPATVDPAIDIGTAGTILGGGWRWEIKGNGNNTDAPYGTGIGSGTFTCNSTSKYDDVQITGYNVNASGGKIVSTAPQWSQQFEADYWVDWGGGNCEDLFEYSLNYLNAAGNIAQRFMAFSVDRTSGGGGTGGASWTFTVGTGSGGIGNNFAIKDTGGNIVWELTPSQESTWRGIFLQTNNITALAQENAAGNATQELLKLDASNNLNIGGGVTGNIKIVPAIVDFGSNVGVLTATGSNEVSIGNSANKARLDIYSNQQEVFDIRNNGTSHWGLEMPSGQFWIKDETAGNPIIIAYDGANTQLLCARSGTVSIANSCGTGQALEVGGSENITGSYRVSTKVAIGTAVDLYVGGSGAGAIATNATGPFIYHTASAGAPTGTPSSAGAGAIACEYDTTNHKLWCYDQPAAAWKGVVLN